MGGEANVEEFRLLRARDSAVSATIASQAGAAPKPIDWAAWEARISHKEVVQCLKDFHSQQTQVLDGVLGEDHHAAVKARTAGWDLFDKSVESCKQSVTKSENILKSGSRALWISYQN